MVRSIGADHVIDYTREDFTKSGQRYHLILDAAAYRSVLDYKRALRPTGIYVMVGGSLARMFQAMLLGPWISMTGGQRVVAGWVVKPNQTDLLFVKELLETGKIVPVIDRCYTLSEVPEAIGYVEKGHAHGKVLITM